jgi:hypothetical protein
VLIPLDIDRVSPLYCSPSIMFQWLKSLFSSKAAVPTPSYDGVYRFSGGKGTKKTPDGTLFPQPAPIPESRTVEVVKPNTEADDYQWIDYSNTFDPRGIVAKESIEQKPDPTMNITGSGQVRSGSMNLGPTGRSINLSGCCIAVTGYAMEVYATGASAISGWLHRKR